MEPSQRTTLAFQEECMVKLKRLLYGEDEARLTFDPRIEGRHREVFNKSARYLASVLARLEGRLTKPYYCHTCGIFGESDLLLNRSGDRTTCLWCSRAFHLIVERFRSKLPRTLH